MAHLQSTDKDEEKQKRAGEIQREVEGADGRVYIERTKPRALNQKVQN
jgi:hypothetical protein